MSSDLAVVQSSDGVRHRLPAVAVQPAAQSDPDMQALVGSLRASYLQKEAAERQKEREAGHLAAARHIATLELLAKHDARLEKLSGDTGEIAQAKASAGCRKCTAVAILIVLIAATVLLGVTFIPGLTTTKAKILFGLIYSRICWHTYSQYKTTKREFTLVGRLEKEQAELQKKIAGTLAALSQVDPALMAAASQQGGQASARDRTLHTVSLAARSAMRLCASII